MDITLQQWLQIPCLPEEVSGDEREGFYLGIEVVKEKLKFMQEKFDAFLNYGNFHHFLFNAHNKNTYASGSIEIELMHDAIFLNTAYTSTGEPISNIAKGRVLRKLIGTATFDLTEYDNENSQNGNYASILKSLCISQALKEYPQFGSLLNKEKLVRTIQGKRNNFKTSSNVKDFQKNL